MERIILLSLMTGPCFLSLNAAQYRFVLFFTPKTWSDAQVYCRQNCLDLATIHYTEEMNNVLRAIERTETDTLWFGLWEGQARSWHWSLTRKDFYKDGEKTFLLWGANPQYNCGYYKNEALYTVACNTDLPFICFDVTKEGEEQYIMVEETMGWTDALNYCKTHYTDLTSVRNDAEIESIQKLASNNSVWVGLFKDPWVWSDEAESSFRNWPPDVSVWSESTNRCGAMLRNKTGGWQGLDCTEKHPFLCSCPIVETKRFQVRISLYTSALDVNDPVVQSSILEQMKLRLSKTGAGDVQLRWRKQSDGRVFDKKTP